MYRERHGCNSLPPLYCLSTAKLIRYCNKNKFSQIIIFNKPSSHVIYAVWRWLSGELYNRYIFLEKIT